MDLSSYIRDIPDFPQEGVVFKDITPLLGDPDAFHETIDLHRRASTPTRASPRSSAPRRAASSSAARSPTSSGPGFVPARKPGKLPWKTTKADYELEYGVDSLEMHLDAIQPGDKVVIVDDVLATGGTAGAKAQLVQNNGGEVVGFAFLIELDFLSGREKLPPRAQGRLAHPRAVASRSLPRKPRPRRAAIARLAPGSVAKASGPGS